MAYSGTKVSLFTIALLIIMSRLSESQEYPASFAFAVEKDPGTKLFYISMGVGSPIHDMNLVLDLGGPLLWYDCGSNYTSASYKPVPCGSPRCIAGVGCTRCNSGPFKPGCTNDTCGAFLINPFIDSIYSGDLGEEELVFPYSTATLRSACSAADETLLKGLPKNAKGIVGLARNELSFLTEVASNYLLRYKLSLCLPSSTKSGKVLGNIFIGDEPTYTAPLRPDLNLSDIMLSTPLIVNPFSTAPIFAQGDPSYEYFISVKAIKVGAQVLNLNPSLFSIDNKGQGGTKLSTMSHTTVLRSAIYQPLVKEFLKQAADRKMKQVAPVGPFGACFELSSIGRTVTGLDAPTIELELQGGVKWTIYGGNSLVLVNDMVACLGFVNGGKNPPTSLVIGGHVLEDNLLVFDLYSNTLSFSSSLLPRNLRCSNIKG